jgi:hypothetical protein
MRLGAAAEHAIVATNPARLLALAGEGEHR